MPVRHGDLSGPRAPKQIGRKKQGGIASREGAVHRRRGVPRHVAGAILILKGAPTRAAGEPSVAPTVTV